MINSCEFCLREKDLTEHHLIPRSLHSTKWFEKNFSKQEMRTRIVMLCRDCHRAVHDFEDEKSLGRDFNTKEALMLHPKMVNFIRWIHKK
jgi:5-methylcytosine-specific restriction endonuclease McrA